MQIQGHFNTVPTLVDFSFSHWFENVAYLFWEVMKLLYIAFHSGKIIDIRWKQNNTRWGEKTQVMLRRKKTLIFQLRSQQ